MILYLHNYTMTPNVVKQIIHQEEKVIIKQLHIPVKGIYTPAIGLLVPGTPYPTPVGIKPIKEIETGCLIF